MTIAEKLTTIAENVPKVYAQGYSYGEEQGYYRGYEDGLNDPNAGGGAEPVIEALTVTKNGTSTAPDGVDGYSPVTVNVPDFWDTYQQNGIRGHYSYAFAGDWWTDDTFKPKYAIKPWNTTYMFYRSLITDLSDLTDESGEKKPRIDFSGVKSNQNCQRPFDLCPVEIIGTVDVSNIGDSINTLFGWNSASACHLHTIQKLIVSENNTFGSNCFQNCATLENIEIKGVIGNNFNMSACKSLSTDSVNSILNALKPLSAGTVMKLQLHSDVLANLTTTQQDIIDTKGWTM